MSFRHRMQETRVERGPCLCLPNPQQAQRRHARDGHTGAIQLAGMVAIRKALLDVLHEEYKAAVRAGLVGFLDEVRRGCHGYGSTAYESVFPYHEQYGTPFLFPEEQLQLRQARHFWISRNSGGLFNDHVNHIEQALWFRSPINDEETVRNFRTQERLGPLGQAREVVSFRVD